MAKLRSVLPSARKIVLGLRLLSVAAWPCLALAFALPVQAKSSVDAVQLDTIALDSSVDCTRTFFKSSQNFNGTIYVMPRVLPEAHDDEHQAFEIESDGQGHYALAMGLYFPRNEEQVKDQWDMEFNKNSRCNFDAVKDVLNKDIQDPQLKIKRIAPMPLTSIEVVIPGVKNVGRIGRSLETDNEVDILDYDGKSLPVEIPITAQEKDGINRRMERIDGVPVQVRFRFQARSHVGGVTATVDWQQLSASLQASIGTKKVITQAEFSAAVSSTVSKMSQTIKVDSGGSPEFDKIAGQIVKTVLAQAVPAVPEVKSSGDADSSNLNLIDVKVALSLVANQSTNVIQYDQNSAPESATAETIVEPLRRLRRGGPAHRSVTVDTARLGDDHALGCGRRDLRRRSGRPGDLCLARFRSGLLDP